MNVLSTGDADRVVELLAERVPIRAIARETGHAKATVARYARLSGFVTTKSAAMYATWDHRRRAHAVGT